MRWPATDRMAAPGPPRHYLARQWLGFAITTAVVLVAGYVAAIAAFFGGGRDGTGRLFYAAGAIGTTGALLLLGRQFTVRGVRLTMVGLGVIVGLWWLVELPAFLRSPGWQF